MFKFTFLRTKIQLEPNPLLLIKHQHQKNKNSVVLQGVNLQVWQRALVISVAAVTCRARNHQHGGHIVAVWISSSTMWKWRCVWRWMTCARVHACVCVCPVDVTVISDQYSPLATDLRSSSLWAQPSGQRRNTHRHAHTNYYTVPTRKKTNTHRDETRRDSRTRTSFFFFFFWRSTHAHTHGRCHRYCPYTPARNYIHNSFYLHNLLVYTHKTIM